MRILGVTGWSGAGKTTLLVKLIPVLTGRGLRVSTVKHAHHAFDVDKPGKDSYLHRAAGATEVLISSATRWALMHENRENDEPGLEQIIARMTPVDLVLVEGFKNESHDKIEVHRHSLNKPLLCHENQSFIALAANYQPENLSIPYLDLNDVEGIANFITDYYFSKELAS